MRKFSLLFFSTFLLLGNLQAVWANEQPVQDDREQLSAFQSYKNIENLNLLVPTVVEVPFASDETIGYDVAVLENETQTFQPWILTSEVEDQSLATDEEALLDKNTLTYAEYEVPEEGKGIIEIILIAEEPIRSSSLTFLLDRYVALPTHITLTIHDGTLEKEVLSRTPMKSTRVTFPETEASEWVIRLEYSQLLRISEIELEQLHEGENTNKAIRFLAQPDATYTVYFNADRPVDIQTGEAGNLSQDEGVKVLPLIESEKNNAYQKEDTDEDGIPNETDNCVSVANPEQTDADGNDRGDECDDYDRDGVINSKDNCPDDPNRDQGDEDGDGVGDTCDDEESRLTEKYPWLPWVGMGFAVAVIAFLFYRTARSAGP